jgi:hypothetical protein
MSTVKLDHVPLLENAQSFDKWKRFISHVLHDEGYWDHVEGTNNPFDRYPKSNCPATCTVASTALEIEAYQEWWRKDRKACGLILRRVSPVTYSCLDTGVDVTARILWNRLHDMYARTDILAQFELRERVACMELKNHVDLDRYLGEFKTARLRFIAMKVPYPEFEMVHHIIRGLPETGTWPHFKQLMIQTMQDHINCEAGLVFPSPPDTLLDLIISRLTIECQRLESRKKKPNLLSEYSNYSNEGGREIAKHAKNPNGVRCTNCGGRSHDCPHCYHEGGGMAGQGPHGHNCTKNCMKRAAGSKSKNPFSPKPAQTEHAHPASVESMLASLELDDGELSCASIDNAEESALVSLTLHSWSTLLDSGATSHLIKSRDFFWTYNTTAANDVKTANARGDCIAIFNYNGQSTRVNLRNCLHAPDAIVNLLSVGRFVTAGVACTFEGGKVLLSVPSKNFGTGPMVNRLFVLDVEYVKPPSASSLPSDLVCFTKVPETLDLWHHRLGHAGEPATMGLLRSASGVSLAKTDRLSCCEPCIFGKQACSPAPTSSTPRTTDILELIHVDICGPFSVTTPHGKLYFVLFLDNASSVCNLQNLADRPQVRDAWRILKAKWEKKMDKKVMRVRFDGAGELGGCIEFLDELALEGIEVEVVAAHEHWKNG